MANQGAAQVSAAASGWEPIAPADAGFAADIEARLDQLIASGRAWNVHGVLILRAGRVVLERYFEGEDRTIGRALGRVAFRPDTLHDMRSVTKSIVGLLYGIALADGKVQHPDEPLYAAFPEYPDLADEPRRKRLTVVHALTMTLGTEWNEEVPYTDPANSEIMMERAADRYRFILDRPIVGEPGRRWTYSGGATALVGRLIAKGTGRRLSDFARTTLFDPLGIGPTEWSAGSDGETRAASGLRMTPRDLARIGQMVLQDGVWDGRRMVPAAWLERTFTPSVSADELRRYGYQWYIGDFQVAQRPRSRLERWVGAFGNGGQRLFLIPGLNIATAITAGNYDTPDQWAPPTRIIREVVLSSIR